MLNTTIDNLHILAAGAPTGRICYMLYPMPLGAEVIGAIARRYGVQAVAITNIDWDNDLTPWPAPGVPAGSPDFEGLAPQFLSRLRDSVMPAVEKSLGVPADAERTLLGVSLSGLFTLWQWLECDLFTNIISLSGSFWYEGFARWVMSRPVPPKKGRAYFLLGNREANSPVPQFRSVQTDTEAIAGYLRAHGISEEFEMVPGNHYQNALPRLQRGLDRMFGTPD